MTDVGLIAIAVFGIARVFVEALGACCAMADVDKRRLVIPKRNCTKGFIQQVWEVIERRRQEHYYWFLLVTSV